MSDGPFYVVQGQWVTGMLAELWVPPSERTGLEGAKQVAWEVGRPTGARLYTAEEIERGPDGRRMVADFFAGDTTRRDLACLPAEAEMLRADAGRFPAEADWCLARAREIDARLRQIEGRVLRVV